jgi:hypothetical protein
MTKKEQHAAVCKGLGIDPATIPMIMDVKDALKHLKSKEKRPTFKEVSKDLRDHFLAEWDLIKITEAMNLQPDGKIWKPDYHTRPLEDKWQLGWVEVKADAENPSGFGFSCSGYDYGGTDTYCGSRFAFKKQERGRFVLKQFEGLFIKKYLILKQK